MDEGEAVSKGVNFSFNHNPSATASTMDQTHLSSSQNEFYQANFNNNNSTPDLARSFQTFLEAEKRVDADRRLYSNDTNVAAVTGLYKKAAKEYEKVKDVRVAAWVKKQADDSRGRLAMNN